MGAKMTAELKYKTQRKRTHRNKKRSRGQNERRNIERTHIINNASKIARQRARRDSRGPEDTHTHEETIEKWR